jgi:hypothetical protein
MRAAELYESIDTTGKVVIIGYYPTNPEQLSQVIKFLEQNNLAYIAEAILDGKIEHFDMTLHPEKGDALDSIRPGTLAVVALHIYGIGFKRRLAKKAAGSEGYFYTKKNHRLFSMTKNLGIPLIVYGDQPKGTGFSFGAVRVYHV